MNCTECGQPIGDDASRASTTYIDQTSDGDTEFCSSWCLIRWELDCLFQFADDDEIGPYIVHFFEVLAGAATRWPKPPLDTPPA